MLFWIRHSDLSDGSYCHDEIIIKTKVKRLMNFRLPKTWLFFMDNHVFICTILLIFDYNLSCK